jgi:DNA-binding NarL/FixJ family response regulator
VSGEYRIFGEQSETVSRPVTVVIADDQALVRSGFRLILKAAGINVVAEAATGEEAVAATRAHRPDVVLMDVRMPVMDGIEATRHILADTPPVPADTPPPAPPAGLRDASCCYQNGTPRIIILTTFDLDEYVYAALSAGANGFLLKDVTPEHLVAAIQLVRTGDALLAPSITRRLVERFATTPPTESPAAATRTGATADAAGTWSIAASGGTSSPMALQHGIGASTMGSGTGAGTAGRAGRDVSALTPREFEVLGLVAHGLSNSEIAADLVLSEATVKTHVARILTKLSLRDRVQAVVLAYETGLISPGG